VRAWAYKDRGAAYPVLVAVLVEEGKDKEVVCPVLVGMVVALLLHRDLMELAPCSSLRWS